MAEQSIGFLISWAARQLRTRFDARARSIGLTRAQWSMIAVVRYHEGATQSEIASQMEINTVTAGRILDRLDAAGLVERRADPEDRRANRIYLTPAIAPVLEKLSELGAEEERATLAGFTAEERDVFSRLLERMIANTMASPVPYVPGGDEDELAAGSVLAADA